MNFLVFLLTVLIPTSTIFAQEPVTCPRFLPSRLMVGEQGRVTPGDANNVRSEPSTSAEQVGQIPGGEMFTVLEGPSCDGTFAWWKIEYNGLTGWTVEGSGDTYWLEPVVGEAETTPTSTAPVFNLDNLTKREVDFTQVEAVAWSQDGHWLAVLENDGIWVKDNTEPDAGARLLRRGRLSNFGRPHIEFMPNTNILAYTDKEQIQFIDVVRGDNETFVEGRFLTDFAFSPDGQLLAVINYDEISVWDIASRTLHWEYEDTGSIDALAFSPDSTLLVLTNEARQLLFWNAHTGEQIGVSPFYDYGGDSSEQIYGLAFSPDGKRLAGGTIEQVALWDVASRQKLITLDGTPPLAYSPGGHWLISASPYEWIAKNDDLIVWDADTGAKLASLSNPKNHYYGLELFVFNPDGSQFITVNSSGYNEVALPFMWEFDPAVQSELVQWAAPLPADQCPGALESKLKVDGQARVRADLGAVNLRSQPTTSSTALLQIPGREIVTIVAGPECAPGTIWWQVSYQDREGWLAEARADAYLLQPHGMPPETPVYAGNSLDLLAQNSVRQVIVSPDNTRLAVASSAGVWLYDLADVKAEPQLLYLNELQINDVAFSPDSKLLAVGTGSHYNTPPDNLNAAWVWNVETGELEARIDRPEVVEAVAFSPNGQLLAVCGDDNLIWNVAEGYEQGVFGGYGADEAFFAPDNRTLITPWGSNRTIIWDAARGTEVADVYVLFAGSFDTPSQGVLYNAVLSPDGLILAGSAGSRIYLWSGITGVQQTEFYKITEEREEAQITISGLAFSPDSQWLVSIGDMIRLWDVSFNSIQVLQAELPTSLNNRNRNHITFSPDGELLAASNHQQTEIWNFAERQPIATVDGGRGVFTADNRLISFAPSSVFIWNALNGELLAELPHGVDE